MNIRIAATVAVVACAAGAGAYLYQQRHVTAPPPSAAEPGAVAAKKLAATVPNFTLADREGKMRSLHDWQGKSLIVNFWATWCAPCRREIPLLQQLQRERSGDGFQVVGIAVDFRDKVLAYADEIRIDYPLLIGEQEALDAAAAFGIDAVGFPFTIFTDAQGRIVLAHMGELTRPEADLILGQVAAVNTGQESLENARATISAKLPALRHPTAGG